MSIENILKAERAKFTLPTEKLSEFLYTPNFYHQMKTYLDLAPVLDHNPNLFNKSRLELVKDTYRYLPVSFNFFQEHP
jgi:hypothetical protein